MVDPNISGGRIRCQRRCLRFQKIYHNSSVKLTQAIPSLPCAITFQNQAGVFLHPIYYYDALKEGTSLTKERSLQLVTGNAPKLPFKSFERTGNYCLLICGFRSLVAPSGVRCRGSILVWLMLGFFIIKIYRFEKKIRVLIVGGIGEGNTLILVSMYGSTFQVKL